MRRAVIAANIVSIIIALFEITFLVAFLTLYDEIKNQVNPNGTMKWLIEQEDISKGILTTSLCFSVLAIVFYSIGIRGARKFNAYMVGAALIFHCASAVFNIMTLNILGIILSVLFIYPHAMLFMAIRKGTMSEKNYVNERHGCCV